VVCWGSNSNGQLGDGTTTDRLTPVLVPGLETAVDIAAGGATTCAVLSGGTVKCWGRNGNGQVGDGTTTDRLVPTTVPGITATMVSVGLTHTCAAATQYDPYCWGDNSAGQLGTGDTTSSKTPVEVTSQFQFGGGGVVTAKWISAGPKHTCARYSDGYARCWGLNANNEVDRFSSETVIATPSMEIEQTVDQMVAGSGWTCLWYGAGSNIICFGLNKNSFYTPVSSGGTSVDGALESSEACATLNSGQVTCWGAGTSYAATTQDGFPSSKYVTVGAGHRCALASNGEVYCSGWNQDGALGVGSTTAVSGAYGVVGLSGLNGDLCDDSCGTAKNGLCEDGGATSEPGGGCSLGTDCSDCGWR
jgi:hypothetical protein